VLTVGTSVGALMPMRMLRPFLSAWAMCCFRFSARPANLCLRGARRSRFLQAEASALPSAPAANGGDILAREGVGFEGRGIQNWQHAVIGDDVRHHMRPTRLRAAIPVVADT
jgi:hypothetical protein